MLRGSAQTRSVFGSTSSSENFGRRGLRLRVSERGRGKKRKKPQAEKRWAPYHFAPMQLSSAFV